MSPPTLRAELAAAVRRVNIAFNALSPSIQAGIEFGFDGLEVELDRAILAGDRPRAIRAIDAWERHWRATFREASK